MPGTIYFIRNEDIYKIGVTNDLDRRMKELMPDEILAIQVTAYYLDYEKELHQKYSHCRIPQTEYFRLSPDEVNDVCNRLASDTNQLYVDEENSDASLDCCGYDRPFLLPITREDAIGDATFIFDKLKQLAMLEAKVDQFKIVGDALSAAKYEKELEELIHTKEVFSKYLFNIWGKLDEDGSEGLYYEITIGMLNAFDLLLETVYSYNNSDNGSYIDFFDCNNFLLHYAYEARSQHS
jgi:hypothetical protein